MSDWWSAFNKAVANDFREIVELVKAAEGETLHFENWSHDVAVDWIDAYSKIIVNLDQSSSDREYQQYLREKIAHLKLAHEYEVKWPSGFFLPYPSDWPEWLKAAATAAGWDKHGVEVNVAFGNVPLTGAVGFIKAPQAYSIQEGKMVEVLDGWEWVRAASNVVGTGTWYGQGQKIGASSIIRPLFWGIVVTSVSIIGRYVYDIIKSAMSGGAALQKEIDILGRMTDAELRAIGFDGAGIAWVRKKYAEFIGLPEGTFPTVGVGTYEDIWGQLDSVTQSSFIARGITKERWTAFQRVQGTVPDQILMEQFPEFFPESDSADMTLQYEDVMQWIFDMQDNKIEEPEAYWDVYETDISEKNSKSLLEEYGFPTRESGLKRPKGKKKAYKKKRRFNYNRRY